ncbi:MAG TPA: hypothetical protein GXX75_10925 [Clostridiales bacterium]|nr:hypothetical protein [Clostridiales bacterium]
MDQNDFFAQLPRGKEDKPLLFGMGPLVYDFHDTDGLYYMLDRDFSGCMLMMFAKPMDPSIEGQVTLDGKPLPRYVLKHMEIMGNMWVLGVHLRGFVTEYSKEYSLHVEGFTDTDGNRMNPQDFIVKGIDRVSPEAKYQEHEAVALQAAQEGIVLLKNEGGILPLRPGMELNLFGKGVLQFRVSAVGAGKINPRYTIDLVEAVRESKDFTLNEELVQFYHCDEDRIPDRMALDRAKEKSDTALMVITRGTGENMDNSTAKGEYYLSDQEEALLQTLTKEFKHTVVILNVGYPIDVTFASRYGVDALVYSGFGGMLAGPALLDVLSGKVNPSGKLPDTWALDYFDNPSSRNFYDCVDKPRLNAEVDIYLDTCYEEDIYVGYRYFTTFNKAVAYPFGFGLSYTTFSVRAENVKYDPQFGITMDINVTNTGSIAGKEVVQVYVGQPEGKLEKPERQLVAFEKTGELQPKESQSFQVEIPKKHLTSYCEETASYIMEAGKYIIYAGNQIDAPECGHFSIDETETIKKVTNLMVPQEPPKALSKRDFEGTWPKGERSGVKEGVHSFLPFQKRKNYEPKFDGRKPSSRISYEDVKKDPSLAEDFVAQMSVEELARISVCASSGWGMEGVGEAGSIYQVEGYHLPHFPVSDGNSGVNLKKSNIGFPSSVTICASFNKELSSEVGRVIGEEARELGMPMILAPAQNIHRNPLNGRQPEYFSEDPYLSGMMAGFYSKGMEEAGVASCIKHLIANNCESSRKRNQSIITERALREIYFKTYEIAMEVHMPASVMTAYNACNGQPTASDPELILGLLREENGFDGFVMTDWTSYDTVDVAEMVQAGNCWITPGSLDDTYTRQIIEGVNKGTIELARLQENVAWMIKTFVRFA